MILRGYKAMGRYGSLFSCVYCALNGFLCGLFVVRGCDNCVDISSHVEIPFHFDFPGVQKFNEVIENIVGDIFVEHFFVTKIIDIKFEGFQLYAPFIWNIVNIEGCKVGKAASGAQAGEFRAGEINSVTASLSAIFKTLQLSFFYSDLSIEWAIGH